MRVLKALRRTWRTLEQVEHFINCYTRSFFFFFFFWKERKRKVPSLRLFSEGTKWSKRCGNSGGISPRPVCSRGFRPKFVPDSLAPASCPVDIPFFQHTKHGKFFFVQISSVTETTRRQFFREKKNDRPTGSATAWGRCCCSGGYLVIFFSSTRCLCWRSLATKRCAATFPQNSVDFNLSRYLRLYLVKKVVK